MMRSVSEYDQRAETWVRSRWPDAKPDPGSVEFASDCAAYASGGWASADVSWLEAGQSQVRTLQDDAWRYDWTVIIRELLELDPTPPTTPPSPAR
jgi:hypothetical protein